MTPPPSSGRADRTAAGILFMVAAALCFSGLDSLAKWTGQFVPPLLAVALRYLSALLFTVLMVRPWANLSLLRTVSPRLQGLRALALVAATVCSFTALHYLPLGQTTAISFAAPLFVAALAGPLLGEWPGPHRAVAILAGFVGVLIVTRPGTGLHPAVFVALCVALANACYALITRRLAGRDRPRTTLFYTGLIGAVLVLPLLVLAWVAPPAKVWLAVGGMGVLATLGHYLMIQANERAAPGTLAPFTYAQLGGAVVLGFLVFGDVPDGWVLLGMAVIAGSGVTMLWLERQARKGAR